MTTVLEIDHVTVAFDGFRALDDLTLTLERGELRCIIGPNGAGKTTLMDVITGKTRPDSGAVRFGGRSLAGMPEHAIANLGIGRKFQRPTVLANHTVFENLELAVAGNKSVWSTLFRTVDARQKARIDEVIDVISLAPQRTMHAGILSHGQKQWLEIGMLLAQDPKVLLIDEPVAGMTHEETMRTAEILASLAGERTVVVVEHDMDFVRNIAENVTVLHEGRVLAEGSMADVQNDPRVVEVYLGQ
ncbi:MAG TPA: urea ABC transporter ATP-binding protein UrtD [Labilithrix sp.]|nr:urea ABC transporter ATP-binding protein UrtD [Labilithrix sp.]